MKPNLQLTIVMVSVFVLSAFVPRYAAEETILIDACFLQGYLSKPWLERKFVIFVACACAAVLYVRGH
jgi:hypothetical protein